MLIMLAGTFFSAISQVLLKQSANMEYKNPLREYLNWRVILAYGIFFGVLLLNTWCYTKVDMKFGPVIDTADVSHHKQRKCRMGSNIIDEILHKAAKRISALSICTCCMLHRNIDDTVGA